MAIALAQNSTFSFKGTEYTVTSVSVEAPQAEIVNATAKDAPAGQMIMVPTGAYTSPGSISVECMGFSDPITLIGQMGEASFETPGGTIARQAICNTASVEARVGDVLRVRFTLTPTDYQG